MTEKELIKLSIHAKAMKAWLVSTLQLMELELLMRQEMPDE